MKLSAILLTIALFVSASVANAATPSQQASQQPGTQQLAEDTTKDAMPGSDAIAPAKPAGKVMPAAKDAKDMKDAPKGNQMAPESK